MAATQFNNLPAFLETVKAPKPVTYPSGRDGLPLTTDYASHNTRMVFGYVLGRAALGRDSLSVLDWGGGLGQYGALARSLFPELQLDYHCRELPEMARLGRTTSPEATFYEDDASALARSYDLIMASGSLQYVQDWQSILKALAGATGGFLYVTRLPIVATVPSFVIRQRNLGAGYQTEYPGWVLNRGEFLRSAVAANLTLVREFLIAERSGVQGAPEQADYRGFLFAGSMRPQP